MEPIPTGSREPRSIESWGVVEMRFAVLGRVRVGIDGPLEPVRSTRRRQLLAALLCRAGRMVPVDVLIEELWRGEPPASAAMNLQTYVHRLRAGLEVGRLRYASPGYVLDLERHELDAHQFEDLAESGRRSLAEGDVAGAADRLAGALTLWDGEPYADLDEDERFDRVEAEASRLVELRTVTLEDRLDADLALARHAALVPELTAALAEHPLRERLRGQLMLALYRSGRGAEALEVYRKGRAVLVDELGIEPGPELRRLQESILDDAPELAAPEPPVVTASATDDGTSARREVPAELPSVGGAFTGRDRELDQITRWLTKQGDGPRIVTLAGAGGVGKSTLALRAARQVMTDFPDGQLYVNLRGTTPGARPVPPEEALSRFLRSLGVDEPRVPAGLDEAAARFRSVTADRRILLVCDDAEDAAQVRPLLPASGGSAALVTSRSALAALDGAEPLRLTTLAGADAVELLGELAGTDRVVAEPMVAEEIVSMCGNLPLAVRIAGARLAARDDWSLSTLADRLRDARTRLDELSHDDLAVRTSCQVGVRSFAEPTASLLSWFGLLDVEHVTPTVAAALVDRPLPQVRRDLERLADAQLLWVDRDRYAPHDLVRLFARERLLETTTGEQRAAAARRVVLHYLARLRAVIRLLSDHPEPRLEAGTGRLPEPAEEITDAAAAGRWIALEAGNLAPIARHALALGTEGARMVVGLAAAVASVSRRHGRGAVGIEINELALAACEDPALATHRASIRRDLAVALSQVGREDEAAAHVEWIITALRESPDTARLVNALSLLGGIRGRQGRGEEAVEHYERAVAASRSGPGKYPREEAIALNNLGNAWFHQGKVEAAGQIWQECLTIHEGLGAGTSMAILLSNLSEYHLSVGESDVAATHAERAVEMYRQVGHRRGEALARWLLADADAQRGHAELARKGREESVGILTELGLLTGEERQRILESPKPRLPSSVVSAL